MKILSYSVAHEAIFELKEEGASELVAQKIRSLKDAQLFVASPKLLETAKTAEKAFEWILANCNLKLLPTELQPLKLHLLKAQQAIGIVES